MKTLLLVAGFVFASLFSHGQTSYTFTGNGSWSVASNWINQLLPPGTLPAGDTINVSPAGGAFCILDIPQTIATGAFLNVAAGANFIVTGNLNIVADTVLQQLKMGLIAYYPFNGNAADESGNGYDLSVQGPVPAVNRFGQAQKAYDFNGSSDMMIIPALLKADSLREFTISAWVNATDINSNAFLSFLSKEPHNCSSFFGLNYGLQYKVWNYMITKFSPSNCNRVIVSDTIPNPLNKWCHIVFTQRYNTQYPSFPNYQYDQFFNGKQVMSSSSGFGNIPIAASFSQGGQVGASSNGDTMYSFYYFKGAIDDVRIYDRVLTADEISKLYHLQE